MCAEKQKDADDFTAWRAMMQAKLEKAKNFQIHCWNEETEVIDAALQYGALLPTDWSWGKVIAGPVTPEFIRFILTMPQPTDREIYDKRTPFFSIVLDEEFCSEHYGTERGGQSFPPETEEKAAHP